MQNKDGGFSAFEYNNNPAWMNRLEFDGKSMFDPSWEDVTGHVLELFAAILKSPHRIDFDRDVLEIIERASIQVLKYLVSSQNKATGAWFGRVSSTFNLAFSDLDTPLRASSCMHVWNAVCLTKCVLTYLSVGSQLYLWNFVRSVWLGRVYLRPWLAFQ
jgi:hypothetical protein